MEASHANISKEPKKPLSAYFLFARERAETMADDVERKARKISAEWKQLNEEERKGFESKALDLKIQYD